MNEDSSSFTKVVISYDPIRLCGQLSLDCAGPDTSIWERLKNRLIGVDNVISSTSTEVEAPWPEVLNIVREFGSRQIQNELNFRFVPNGQAAEKIKHFSDEIRKARAARDSLVYTHSISGIEEILAQKGFVKRKLKPFQLRDLQHLSSMANGANFSVPGAGKTTVTLALHVLVSDAKNHALVVGPKASFPAWREIVAECMSAGACDAGDEDFYILDGDPREIDSLLRSGRRRFVVSYETMVRQGAIFATYLARNSVHLILDESHRIKAGESSQRGAFLLNVANLPRRKDILTGTPMPQGPEDIAAQLGFLWPGHEYRHHIQRGIPPRKVLGNLYVRTTKSELGLQEPKRLFHRIEMAPGQMALYAVVRNESLRQLSKTVGQTGSIDFIGAKKSVMRLLQLSTNPTLALKAMSGETIGLRSGVIDQVLAEGPSKKMRAVAAHARELAARGEKSVIWTIFTETISEMERMLADLNPVTLFGAIPTGDDTSLDTREGRLRKFHEDQSCMVMIANPAAAGEGISLHTVCHTALYLDRSYVSTHYLQSQDRIHRLGLPPGIDTNIHIYQTSSPVGLGSIDMSVSRRLRTKLRNLQLLLDDPDLHQVALDEESAIDPVDYDIDLQDLVDLVEELEGKKPQSDEDFV